MNLTLSNHRSNCHYSLALGGLSPTLSVDFDGSAAAADNDLNLHLPRIRTLTRSRAAQEPSLDYLSVTVGGTLGGSATSAA